MSTEHDKHVLAGYKATLRNPGTSPEAKARAEQVLRDAGVDPDEPASPTKPHAHVAAEPDEHERHQLAGFKSVLARADTSAEAKEHARRETERIEGPSQSELTHKEEVHHHHVIGGYKATLHNARTSDDAKEHAREKLLAEGVDPDNL